MHIIKDVFGDIENSNIPEASKHEDQTDGKLQHVYNLEYGGEYSQDTEKLNEDTSDCDVNEWLNYKLVNYSINYLNNYYKSILTLCKQIYTLYKWSIRGICQVKILNYTNY